MARKAKKVVRSVEPTGNPILEVKYNDPLFSIAAHPTEPIFVSGLATGHVFCNRYDASTLEERMQAIKDEQKKKSKTSVKSVNAAWWTQVEDITNSNEIVTCWKTKRHKGSCRLVLFDPIESSVGKHLFTVGKDHVIKKANTETGKVVTKTDISKDLTLNDAVTKLCHSTTHPFLLSGTENGHVLVYDSNDLGNKFKVEGVHDDSVNHILAMPSISPYHYLTVGSTTLSHIDIRKGIVTQSDDQEDELLSMSFVPDDDRNDTVLVAQGGGIVTIWKNSKNKLMDQLSRIKVNKEASIDVMISAMDAGDDDMAASVWCGDSDGLVHRVNYKKGKPVETRLHGTNDEVGFLDIDYEYRLLTAGMDSMKLWLAENEEESESEDSDESDESDEESDESDISGGEDSNGSDSGSEEEDESSEEDESGEEEGESEGDEGDINTSEKEEANNEKPASDHKNTVTETTKKNKRQASQPKTSGETKKQKLKQASKVSHSHGIRRFDGL